MLRRRSIAFMALAVAACVASRAEAAIDHSQAESIFRQAHDICARDAGRLWGHTLCGPMVLVDPDDNSVVANQADANGALVAAGGVFVGTLPASVPISDTTIEWSGTRWCELIWPWPMREDPDMRHVTLAHESFHRIQAADLHLQTPDGNNPHLDTLEGRYLMELEWRALAAALQASTPAVRNTALSDAVLFRQERYRLFPQAAENEAALESNEAMAEYTGVKLGLPTPQERLRYALRDLSAYTQVPTLVRSFAYATGPAYGLLLDQASPGWVRDFLMHQFAQRFDQRVSAAFHLPEPDFSQLAVREAVYDSNGSLRAHELARDHAKREELAAFSSRLVAGPVLTLPMGSASMQFKPLSLVPLAGVGTVYPTLTLTDAWGTLSVKSGGALLRKQPKVAAVSATGFDQNTRLGDGFTLTLKPGWTIQPGARQRDLVVEPLGATTP